MTDQSSHRGPLHGLKILELTERHRPGDVRRDAADRAAGAIGSEMLRTHAQMAEHPAVRLDICRAVRF
jgi:hypothetical protein